MSTIIETLAKLIAHEKSARAIGSQAEAEAFAGKIAALLTKHKISMSEVEYQAQEKSNPLGEETVTRKGTSSTPQWRISLAGAIARSMYCDILFFKGMSAITFIGRDQDRQAAMSLYNFLADVAKKLATKGYTVYTKEYSERRAYYNTDFAPHKTSPYTWKQSFLLGFAAGIRSRMKEKSLEMLAGQSEIGLMLRDELLLKQFIEVRHPNLKSATTRSSKIHSDAYMKGKAHGSSVSLSQRLQIGAGK